MSIIYLKEFGSQLTGRTFGKEVAEQLMARNNQPPISFDCAGVNSIGSSFAEEVFPVFAKKQNDRLLILNANNVVQACLKDIASDFTLNIEGF